jgi:hypothetical protein
MTTLPLQRYSSEGTTARMAEVATDMVNQIAFTPDQKGRSMNMGEGGSAKRGCKWPGLRMSLLSRNEAYTTLDPRRPRYKIHTLLHRGESDVPNRDC